MLPADRESSEGLEQAQGSSEASSGKGRHAALTEDGKTHSTQGVCPLWEGVCGSIIQ